VEMARLPRRDRGTVVERIGLVFALAALLLTSCQSTSRTTGQATGQATGQTAVSPSSELAAQRVSFKSGDGVPLSAYFYRANTGKTGPAIIMLHGCSGLLSKRGALKKREAAWRDILLAEGYHVLLVDSFNPRGVRTICRIKARPVLPDRDRPYDVYGALAWLQKQLSVASKKIALMGWSNGAMAMLWSIRDDARQRPNAVGDDFITAVGFYPGCIKIGRTAFKASVPTLLQVGLADSWTMPKPCLALVDQSNDRGGAPMQIDAYEDAAHGFDHPDSRLREITTRNSVYKSGAKIVSVGTNHPARNKAIKRVKTYLRAAFARGRP
ncbi:MAG: dienelactone hydrolase family protein, partial [Alphaproteobacteria bacterium]|nr:dienelactone hydrolase family protein [Alphaproteobacteria bacterium]